MLNRDKVFLGPLPIEIYHAIEYYMQTHLGMSMQNDTALARWACQIVGEYPKVALIFNILVVDLRFHWHHSLHMKLTRI